MRNIIEVKNLVKNYGDVLAVDNINFEIKEGEAFGFLGPNGAGKSTTISMITTLIPPTSGSITLDGNDVVKDPMKVRKAIGLVPQELTADDELSGRENMNLQADLYNVPKDIAKKRIDELLKIVGLEDAADRRVDTYSGGMRKRLELAEGLIHRPKILFLDEPTLGLDVQTRETMWEYIRRIRDETQMTVFLTTHYLEEADSLCDRIAIIDEGKIKIIGTPTELKMSLDGNSVDVTIKGEDDRTKEIMGLEGVTHVSKNNTDYNVITDNGDRTIGDILSMSANNDWKIRAISLNVPSMNQVFLKYTGKSLRDTDDSSNKMNVRREMIQNRRRRR